MKTILKIFKNDLIGIKKSILTIVLAVGLCILPALYAWFNIFANWDPYANTGNINITVVNLDKGYTDADGNEMNMGQSVVDKLKSQTSIGWVFPESEKSAIGGVKSGTYYAAVVIDEDFSYNMFNALTDNFVNPSFTYYENEKKNAVAPKITDTAVSTLKTSINETYVKAISQKLITAIDDSDTDLSKDLKGTDFITALKTVDDNLAGYQKTIDSIIKANNKLKTSTKLKDATDKSSKLLSDAGSAIDSSMSDIDSVGSTYYTVRNSLQDQIDSIAQDIQNLKSSAKLIHMKDDAENISADLENIKADADKLQQKIDAVDEYIKSLDISNTNEVSDALNKLDKLKTEVKKISSLTADTIDSLDISAITNAENAVSDKLDQIIDSVSNIDDTFTSQVIPDMDNIILNIKNALKNAQDLLNTLNSTISSASSVFDNYKVTIASMNTSLTDLSDLISGIRDKIQTATDEINKAADSEVTDMIIAFLNGDSEALASFLSKPVAVEEHYYYSIANYGTILLSACHLGRNDNSRLPHEGACEGCGLSEGYQTTPVVLWKIPYFLPVVSASGSGHSAWRSVPAEDTVSAPICILGNCGTHRADIFNIDIFTHHIIWRHRQGPRCCDHGAADSGERWNLPYRGSSELLQTGVHILPIPICDKCNA